MVFAATMVANVLNYSFRLLAARHVTVAEYGELSSVFAFVNLFFAPAAILGIAVTKYASEFHAVSDVARLKTLRRLVLILGVIMSSGVFGAIVFAGPVIAAYLNIADQRLIVGGAAIIAVYFTVPSLWALLQGTQRFSVFAISTSLDAILKVGLGLTAIFTGYHIVGALFLYAAGGLVALGYTIAILCSDDRAIVREPIRFNWTRLRQTLGGVTVATVAMAVLASVDVVLVQHFFRSEAAGMYAAVTVCGKVLFFVVGFLPAVVLPKASQLVGRGLSPKPVLIQALVVVACISAVGLAGFFFAPRLVITAVASERYSGGAPYVFAYGVAMFLLAAMNVIVNYRVGIHSFGFVVPLCIVVVAEVITISLFTHHSFAQIIGTLIAGNACAVLIMLLGAHAPVSPLVLPPKEEAQT